MKSKIEQIEIGQILGPTGPSKAAASEARIPRYKGPIPARCAWGLPPFIAAPLTYPLLFEFPHFLDKMFDGVARDADIFCYELRSDIFWLSEASP